MIVGVRYTFPEGLVVEFTHTADSIQPAEAWVAAHKKAAKRARVEEFKSDVPVNRSRYPDGTIVDHLKEGK